MNSVIILSVNKNLNADQIAHLGRFMNSQFNITQVEVKQLSSDEVAKILVQHVLPKKPKFADYEAGDHAVAIMNNIFSDTRWRFDEHGMFEASLWQEIYKRHTKEDDLSKNFFKALSTLGQGFPVSKEVHDKYRLTNGFFSTIKKVYNEYNN